MSTKIQELSHAQLTAAVGHTRVYRLTGPPENFITALTIGYWAFNKDRESDWRKLRQGDILLLHSTRKSAYSNDVQSCVIGYARVGQLRKRKVDFWWVQEYQQNENIWPYAFSLEQVYLFGDVLDQIDLTVQVHRKTRDQLRKEVMALSGVGVTVKSLNERAKKRNASLPNFPVNGSFSGLNDVYLDLIFSALPEGVTLATGEQHDEELETFLIGDEQVDRLEGLTKNQLLALAKQWSPPTGDSFAKALRKIRKEDVRQKRLVALLEDNTCQVCGFSFSYTDLKGKKRWIIDIDHIVDKAAGGDESLENLWALCPNCHRKKTSGVIRIDLNLGLVVEGDKQISIRNNHLSMFEAQSTDKKIRR